VAFRHWQLALLGGLLTGCGTLPDGRRWGEDALAPPPSAGRVGRSALRAAIDPFTWAPAIGAAVFQIDDFDRRVSSWAMSRTPIFGSMGTASDASNYLLWTGWAAGGATTIATPSGDDPGQWLLDKVRGIVVEGAGVASTEGVTIVLADAVVRTRPSGVGQDSFPSGHASDAFAFATLTSRNLSSIDMPDGARMGLQAGAYGVAAGTAWARVEGGHHFPSDVLAGAAIGHFLTAFFYDAFLGLPEKGGFLGLAVEPSRSGCLVAVEWGL
jgi:membrane-associated phospholipid phosphatase